MSDPTGSSTGSSPPESPSSADAGSGEPTGRTEDAGVDTDPNSTGRLRWIPVFVVAALLGIAWSFASPMFGPPDESSHVVKAAGVVRGQPAGSDSGPEAEFGSRVMTDVPAVLAQVNDSQCFAFRDGQVTADCFDYRDVDGTATVATTAGRHPPFYYAIVGVPSLVTATSGGVYAMRIVSALGVAAMIAMAWVCLGATRHPRAARLGLAITLTPMAVYLGGTVNPNGWEIAAAVLLWSAGFVLLGGGIRSAFVHAAGVGAVVLALTRQLGPAWLVLILATLLVLAEPSIRRSLWRRRDVKVWLVAIAAALASQVTWVLVVKPLDTVASGLEWTPDFAGTASWTRPEILQESIGRTMGWYHQWIGVFGALDTYAPRWTYLVWTAALFGLIVAGIVAAKRRELVVGALLVVAVLAIPILAEQREFYEAAFFWQGRYTMPLAVGIPMLAATALARRVDVPGRLAAVVGVLLASAQVFAFAQALRRYSAGRTSEGLAFWRGAPWSPPIPSLLLIVAFTGFLAAWYWLLLGPWGATRSDVVEVPAGEGDADGSGSSRTETAVGHDRPGNAPAASSTTSGR